jgi:glycosyltransferase involved in cell wall biosynthesis
MKIVMLSKALVSSAYQKKLEELARLPEVELLTIVPPHWREPLIGTTRLEHRFTQGYRLETLPIVANGHHHLYFFRGLPRVLKRERPDIVHIDEESFNLATFLALRAAQAVGTRCCFYNWANIDRYYPPPFCLFEQYAFRHAAYAIAGNQEAATIMRRHGYHGRLAILPQFGVDPHLFAPSNRQNGVHDASERDKHFVVGYIGRFIAWKGVFDLLDAMQGLPDHVRLRLVGDGDVRPALAQRARETGIAERVEICNAVGSTEVPAVLHGLDLLVLPSRTQPNWKEQFGRILIEAMSCGVPVVGSSSGEIPNVINEAGIVFPEGDIESLRNIIVQLLHDLPRRQELSRRGRERVLAHYTQAALAERYYTVYREMV